MWLPSEDNFQNWVAMLTPLAAFMAVDNNFLVRSEANYLTASLYKTLKRKESTSVRHPNIE